MSDNSNCTIFVGVGSDNSLEFRHVPTKEESRHLSEYQEMGLIYLQMFSAASRGADLFKPAMEHFRSAMRQKGFQEDEIRMLLSADGWQERMLFSWYALGEQARAASIAIDYDRFQNYWPNLDFLKKGWGESPYLFVTL